MGTGLVVSCFFFWSLTGIGLVGWHSVELLSLDEVHD
jgi:hypothetical protein